MKVINLYAYTAMHFLVDLSCIFFLMGMVYTRLPGYDQWIRAAVIYNAFAFALPALIGFIADITGKNAFMSLIGCAMILVNYIIIPAPWVSVVLLGVGNGVFHIGGGRQILIDAGGKFAPSGIFISSGALGVYLGRSMASEFRQIYMSIMIIMLSLCVSALIFLSVRQWKESVRKTRPFFDLGRPFLIISVMLFVVVVIRSYYGTVAIYQWNSGFWMGLIFTLCIVAGKFTGGLLADRLGLAAASVISLAGAGALALFAPQSPVAGCASILLFNMTMPLTLTLLSDVWEGMPGFSFGVLMLALFLGTLPTMVLRISWLSAPLGLLGLCMISLALMLAAVFFEKRAETG